MQGNLESKFATDGTEPLELRRGQVGSESKKEKKENKRVRKKKTRGRERARVKQPALVAKWSKPDSLSNTYPIANSWHILDRPRLESR